MGGQVVFVMTVTEPGGIIYSRMGVFKSFPTPQQACELILGIGEVELLNEYLNPAHRAMGKFGFVHDVYISWTVRIPEKKDQTVTIHCQGVK